MNTPPIVSTGTKKILIYLEEVKIMLEKTDSEKKAFSTVSTKKTSLKDKKSSSLRIREDVKEN